jgi:hypothetical protein
MSNRGLTVAHAYGEHLPEFKSVREAELELFGRRDRLLDNLRRAVSNAPVRLDDSPQSLKDLEAWYFKLLDRGDDFNSLEMNRDELECAISMYLGTVVVANVPGFKWLVQEFAFLAGRYEIGIGVPLFKVMLTGGSNLQSEPNNKRRQSLFRQFRKCAQCGPKT